jgi:hypothetical protein
VVDEVAFDSLPEFPLTRFTVATRTDPSVEIDFSANVYGVDGDRLVFSVVLQGPPMKEIVIASVPIQLVTLL